MNIERPKNVLVALVFSCIAWIVMRFFRSPRSEQQSGEND